jgi:hypothetical protein
MSNQNAPLAFQKVLIAAVSAADEYYNRGNLIAQRDLENQELVRLLTKLDFGMALFSGHQMYMQSGFNSFLTLRHAMMHNGFEASEGHLNLNVKITINGFAGLLRQTIESLIRSVWLLDVTNRAQISERGFAVIWENATNRLKYEQALKSPKVEESRKYLDVLRIEGITKGLFLVDRHDSSKYADDPRIQIEDASGLLRKVITPIDLPVDLLAQRGIGFVNAEWVYRWLSGLTHGLDWAHIGNELPENLDFALTIRKPDLERFSIAAMYVLQISQRLFALTDGDFQKRLSSMFEPNPKPL